MVIYLIVMLMDANLAVIISQLRQCVDVWKFTLHNHETSYLLPICKGWNGSFVVVVVDDDDNDDDSDNNNKWSK